MSAASNKRWRSALVIGSGIGGLLAARVLADAFDAVTVIERDAEPGDASPRHGAQQGFHPHGLLTRGEAIMERLFPGFAQALTSMGAVSMDPGREVEVASGPDRGVAFDTPFRTLSMTRGLLELCLRRFAASVPNITIRYGVDADRLILGPDGKATGVAVRAGERDEVIEADLIVDAGGRAAQATKWLAAHSFPTPPETSIGLDFGYATALFDIPPDFDGSWRLMYLLPRPPKETVGLAAFEVEGKRWMVGIAGRGSGRPTADPDAFVPFAARHPDKRLHDWLSRARRVSDVKTYRFAAAARRHFEKLDRHPENFIAFGDALCSLNPVYGQGMSVAAMEAEALMDLLRQRQTLDGLWRAFYARAAALTDLPWTMALELDMQFDETKVARPALYPLQRRILGWASGVIMSDPALRAKVFARINLMATPADEIGIGEVLKAQWRQWATPSRPAVVATRAEQQPAKSI